jgi:hypothetical protein
MALRGPTSPGPTPSTVQLRYAELSPGGLSVGGTNIVFPNGNIDPWHALSVVHNISASVTAIYIHGTAHWFVAAHI